MTRSDLGERLLALRENAGLTQREVSLEIDTAEVTISRWESGANTPTVRNLRKLAKVFGVDWRYIRDGGDIAPSPKAESDAALQRVKDLLDAHPEIAEALLRELGDQQG